LTRAERVGRRALWAALVLVAAPARADDDGPLSRLAADVRVKLDAASKARIATPTPPVPVTVKWKAVKVGSVDLGDQLVALAAADLDRDGKAELYAVTARDVVAISLTSGRAKELGRVAFSGELAARPPRDVVGVAVADAGVVVASVSTWARGLRVSWHGKTLVADPAEPGFLLCPGEHALLAEGRNYFGDAANAIYAARCRADLVDPTGLPLRIRAALSITGKLDVDVETCAAPGACHPAGHYELANVGVAFDVADVDRDGKPEVVYASASAPGDPDMLRVVTLGDDDKRPPLKKFTGGVAGVVAIDLDGNGTQEVVAAVRLVGSTQVDLWRLL
jgi:hypothetical protein